MILTVAGIPATIGVGWFFKASAQTTTVNGGVSGGAVVGAAHGTINNIASNADNCRSAPFRIVGGQNVTIKSSTSRGYDCGVDMQNTKNGVVEGVSSYG